MLWFLQEDHLEIVVVLASDLVRRPIDVAVFRFNSVGIVLLLRFLFFRTRGKESDEKFLRGVSNHKTDDN